MGLIESAVTRFHRWAQQSANPATPASTYWHLFFKAGGLYSKSSAGDVIAYGGGVLTTLTIASGAITVTAKHHFVDTEAAASSDDLTDINGGFEGQELFLQADQSTRTVVIKHASGNIRTPHGGNISLDETYKVCHLVYDGSFWNATGFYALPSDLGIWGTFPDDSVVLAMQSGTSLFQITASEMRQWVDYSISSDIGTSPIADTHYVFTDATDRTITIGTIAAGVALKAYAMAASGGTGHKILLPASHYWGSTGTNRAALLNTADEYISAVCHDVGGGTKRMLIDANNGVTFAAS